MPQTVMITGAAGFIGSNFARYWRDSHPGDNIIIVDAITYAGNIENIASVDNLEFVRGSIGDTQLMMETLRESSVDIVVNFAAETHNSLAVSSPASFFRHNVMGTVGLLEAIREVGVDRFHHVSSSEVYGPVSESDGNPFMEQDAYRPTTPYSASKASCDHVIRSYCSMYALPATIGVSVNNYGPHQFPEKIIPLFITNALSGHPLPLYSSSSNTREYIHVTDHCRAIEAILENGVVGETYNVGSGEELSIDEIADRVISALGVSSELKQIVQDRPGHTRRHALNSTKLRTKLKWKPTIHTTVGIPATAQWYANNSDWWIDAISRRKAHEFNWRSSSV